MPRQSPRLDAALELLTEVDVLADVGTDHGYFPIAVLQAGKARRAIATDNKAFPLASARENIEKAGLSDRILLVMAEGLSFLSAEVDAVSIMGMGGNSIAQILDSADLSAVRFLLLEPNNDHAIVRVWLENHHWAISAERFVRDHGHDYQLFAAVRGAMSLSEAERIYGPLILCEKAPAFVRHIERKIQLLTQAKTAAVDPGKIQELQARISHLQELIR